MQYVTTETTEAVIVAPTTPVTATVIWLHGLGADGHDFVPLVPELRLPDTLSIRFIFPHARLRAVTINNGYTMRAWYDIKGVRLEDKQDEVGIRDSENVVRGFIQRERDSGIVSNRILIAGFSQGGAIALHTGLRYPQRLGGVMALSTYLPLHTTLAEEATQANRETPFLICHGTQDSVVPYFLGKNTKELLEGMGYQVEWKEYSMAHSVCPEQIAYIATWLRARLQ